MAACRDYVANLQLLETSFSLGCTEGPKFAVMVRDDGAAVQRSHAAVENEAEAGSAELPLCAAQFCLAALRSPEVSPVVQICLLSDSQFRRPASVCWRCRHCAASASEWWLVAGPGGCWGGGAKPGEVIPALVLYS